MKSGNQDRVEGAMDTAKGRGGSTGPSWLYFVRLTESVGIKRVSLLWA